MSRATERLVLRGLVALVAISLAMAACGEGPAAQNPATTHSSGKTTTAASTAAGVFFPTQKPPKFGYEELQSGELIRDAEGVRACAIRRAPWCGYGRPATSRAWGATRFESSTLRAVSLDGSER